MRARLVATIEVAGGVRRHMDELRRGLESLGWDFVGSGRVDIVHIHLHNTFDRRAAAMALHARARGAAVVLTEHLPRTNASDPTLFHGTRHYGAAAAKQIFKRSEAHIARRIITVCEASRSFLGEHYGIRGSKVCTVRNGIELPARIVPPEPRGPLRVLAIGTLNTQKGHDVLIAAAARARGDWHATIVGSGASRPSLERLIEAAAGERVVLAGWRQDARDAPTSADVLCLPSRWEACPYVVLDAMARARCVVASRVDGLPELVEQGVSGLLVEPDDPDALALALDHLAANPLEVRRMGLAARERAEARFGVERMVAATHDVYRDALNA